MQFGELRGSFGGEVRGVRVRVRHQPLRILLLSRPLLQGLQLRRQVHRVQAGLLRGEKTQWSSLQRVEVRLQLC